MLLPLHSKFYDLPVDIQEVKPDDQRLDHVITYFVYTEYRQSNTYLQIITFGP